MIVLSGKAAVYDFLNKLNGLELDIRTLFT
jgi:hypothetical protein